MCEMVNVFLPRKAPLLGPAIRGFRFASGGELQEDFRLRFAREPGTFLTASCDRGCLCEFADWEALHVAVGDLLTRNGVAWLAAVHFWSGDRYSLAERTADPDDTGSCIPIELGELVVFRTGSPEQRRHRLVVRDLGRSVGKVVSVELKNGALLQGVLEAFDAESEAGSIAGRYFAAGQVRALEHFSSSSP